MSALPEKWQWVLALNPMTAVINGFQWGVARHRRARPRQDAREHRGDCRRSSSSGSGTSGAPSRASPTRSDDASRSSAEGLSKRYRIGELHSAYGTLRDSLALRRGGRVRREHRAALRGDLGASRRLVRGPGRRGPRRDRPQRRRQVDAAQDPDPDHDADERSRDDPRPGRQPARGRHRVPPRAHRPRERLPQRLAARDEAAGDPAGSSPRSSSSPGSSSSSTRRSSATRAGCPSDSPSPSPRISSPRSCSSTRCSRSATPSSSAAVSGGWRTSAQSGRTVLFVSHHMQAVAQLCDRAILPRQGRRSFSTGRAPTSSPSTCRPAAAAARAAMWSDLETRPATTSSGCARYASSRTAVAGRGRRARTGRDRDRVHAFSATASRVFPKIKVYDARRNVAFNALDTSPRWHEPAPPGEYVSTAWIPANLLNEGLIRSTSAVCSLGTHEVPPSRGANDAVSFHVQRSGRGRLGEGVCSRDSFAGVVRPLLEWTTRLGRAL